MSDIAGFIKAALIDVGAATKVGGAFRIKVIEKIREYENKINSTEDLNARTEYYKELMDILSDPKTGGKQIEDYHKLMQLTNKQRTNEIKIRNGRKT